MLLKAKKSPLDYIVYPDSDGQPMADNTKQAHWIVVFFGNLAALFDARPDVFVAMDNLWYPVESEPEVRVAPDVYVVFGRPKGHRSSYKQWEEGNVPLTVVIEILSPKNTVVEMDRKLDFYDEHGTEEYYLYDPDTNHLTAYIRQGQAFRKVRPVQGFVSPRLGIRFDLSGPELVVHGPDGRPFLTFEQLKAARDQAEQRASQAEQRAVRLAELSRKARHGQASAEELQELERLEEESAPPSP
jgi:Uma2 family endonuclease